MASKQYISIIRLFEHSGITADGEINVSRIKKQLTAEFGITASGIIEIDGHSYNKNDVFEEIEKTDFTTRLQYHQKIWATRSLLSFLEDAVFNEPQMQAAMRQFQNDTVFDSFISPYFAHSFNYSARNYLNELKLYAMGELLLFEEFILGEDREEALRPVRLFLDDQIRLLKNTNTGNYKLVKPKIQQWIDSDWSSFVNNLPHEFYNSRNEISSNLVNVTVAIQKTYKADCKKISYQLTSLSHLSPELADIIYNNHKVYTSNPLTRSSGNWGWIIWLILILVRIISGC